MGPFLGALLGLVLATLAPGGGPSYDVVQGRGGAVLPGGLAAHFHASAKSGPAGEDPQGQVLFRGDAPVPTGDVRGRVTCLTVTGNQATGGGELESLVVTPGGAELRGFVFAVADNGRGGEAPPDLVSADLQPRPPATCPVPSGPAPLQPGTFVVHDAAP